MKDIIRILTGKDVTVHENGFDRPKYTVEFEGRSSGFLITREDLPYKRDIERIVYDFMGYKEGSLDDQIDILISIMKVSAK